MSRTKMKITGMRKLEKILLQYPAMAERAIDWRPIGAEINQTIAADFKHMYRTKRGRPGQMERLGPSLVNASHSEHIWEMGKTDFTFGTSVPYSFWYAQWQRGNNRRSHIQFRARARRAVRDIVMRYIVEGK